MWDWGHRSHQCVNPAFGASHLSPQLQALALLTITHLVEDLPEDGLYAALEATLPAIMAGMNSVAASAGTLHASAWPSLPKPHAPTCTAHMCREHDACRA